MHDIGPASASLILFQGLGLVSLVSIGYGHIERLPIGKEKKAVLQGLGFGIGAVICMLLAVRAPGGVLFDVRNLFVGFSAAFCGAPVLPMTMVIAAAGRLVIGGTGLETDLVGMVIAGLAGLLWRHVMSGRIEDRRAALILLGTLIGLSLVPALALPAVNGAVIADDGPAALAFYVMGALLLGSFIEREDRLLRRERLLETDAFTDPLTGLANRRRFETIAHGLFAGGHAADAALLVIDIDHFKTVNDRHGHLAGDLVLKATAQAIARTVRGSDVVGRIGGEEFAVLATGLDQNGAARLAERIRTLVSGLALKADSDVLKVTVSIGCAMAAGLPGYAACFRTADRALYDAKHAGRNRVSLAVRAEAPPAAAAAPV